MLLTTLACQSTLRHPTLADASWAATRWSGATLAELEAGRKIYVRRCAGCHTLYSPEAHPPEYWRGQLGTMAEDAKISEDEQELIARFLITLSTRTSTTAS
ncbi:MAG: cytochrome c [Deltaproteobacteria bacterium]|nr:cytochrome c [Deltaproteobacteria bacterium]